MQHHKTDATLGNGAFFSKEFPSSFEAMAAVLDDAVDALLRNKCIEAEDSAWVRLCLEEALVNAIRHGNRCDARRRVRLMMEAGAPHCVIRVQDEGPGFDPDAVHMPDCEQLGGRGICLIRHYMDKVRYNRARRSFEMEFCAKNPANREGEGVSPA